MLEVKSAAAEGKEYAILSYRNLVAQLDRMSDIDLALQGQRATLLTGGQRVLGSYCRRPISMCAYSASWPRRNTWPSAAQQALGGCM